MESQTEQDVKVPVDETTQQTPAQKAEAVPEAETQPAQEIPAQDAEALNADLKSLKEALAAAQTQSDEYLSMAQRVQADFDNFRRRNANVRADAYEDGAAAFAVTLLPVLDNLERALDAANTAAETGLKEGVDMTYRQLTDAFSKRGITVIDRAGEKFDPTLENAVIQGTAEDGEPGTVCQVLQKGYIMGKNVLRHAMVKVVPD